MPLQVKKVQLKLKDGNEYKDGDLLFNVDAEAWAKGTRNGQVVDAPVTPDSSYPHAENNAEYYAEQAGNSASAAAQAVLTGNLAPTFDTTTAYSKGDYVIYNGKLYYFTANHAAGAWTGSDATEQTVDDALKQIRSDIQDLENIVADEFATNKTYAIGQYVLYEGDLYKFITIHNEGDWDNSQVVLVKINSEIANINSQIGELKIQLNKVVKWEETILTNHGRGAWVNNNAVIEYVSAQSGSNYALVPYAVNSGDMIQVVGNNPYIKAVFFVNENEGNYELISANTYSGNGKRDYNETFIIESGVSHILINKYGSGTVSCKNLVAKTDKALSTANIPADAQITGLKFAEILAILKN